MSTKMVPLGQGGTFIAVFLSPDDPRSEELIVAYEREVERRGSPFVIPHGNVVDPETIPVVLLIVRAPGCLQTFDPPITSLPTEQILTNVGLSNRRSGDELQACDIATAFDTALRFKESERNGVRD